MKSKNSLLFRSRISERKYREIVKYFVYDFSSTQIAELVDINRNTVNRYITLIRERIALFQEETGELDGEIELDESYFGGKRKGDKRGRGVTNKVPVFGIKKRNGKVYTQIIKNASRAQILPIIKRIINKDATIYTDGWRAYDGLVLDGYKHYRINHSKEFSNRRGNHINGIENFWGWSKMRLAKFRGVSRKSFYFHLKECEWRFNNREKSKKELYVTLLSILRD